MAREPHGPRGQSSLTQEERDDYNNLILLCSGDHTLIDKAPADYTVEFLTKTKADHEAWVNESLSPKIDPTEIKWAEAVDKLCEKLGLEHWGDAVHPFFAGGPIRLRVEIEQRLQDCAFWIAKRPWPPGHDELKAAIVNMGLFLNELLSEFNVYAELHDSGRWRTYPAFYKIPNWNPPLYASLLEEYKDKRSYLSDLTLEITRYINLFSDLVRRDLDPHFRYEEGLTEVLVEGQLFGEYGAYIPQFDNADQQFALGSHPLGLFKDSRHSRSPRFEW